MKQKIKLAEALLRRKELQAKVAILSAFKNNNLYTKTVNRVKVEQGIDELTITSPVLDLAEVTHEYDWHAKQLRLVDAAIQQCNWTAEVDVDPEVMADFYEKFVAPKKQA